MENIKRKKQKREYKYDGLITELRKVVPCNRTTLREASVEYVIGLVTSDEEPDVIPPEGLKKIAEIVLEYRKRNKRGGKKELNPIKIG